MAPWLTNYLVNYMADRKTTATRARAAARRAVSAAATRRGGPRAGGDAGATRAAVFAAAADAFSRRGFDGVSVDDIARDAGVNKAMIYYHFDDKLALYREIVRDMLRDGGSRLVAIAQSSASAADKMARFIEQFVAMTDARPYFPPLMVREMVEGGPRLDSATLAMMRTVFMAFGHILADGAASGEFRRVNPVLAYMSILGPLLLNAARERAAAQPGREQLPMFAPVPHVDLTRHMQEAARRMLSAPPPPERRPRRPPAAAAARPRTRAHPPLRKPAESTDKD
jgi:AcrR family transcriptional regulator